MEQLRGQIRDGVKVLYDGPIYLAAFDIAGEISWCGVVVTPSVTFRPNRANLALHLTDGRSAEIRNRPGTPGR